MKNAPTGKTNKSALDALLSMVIIAANSTTAQQAFALLVLMTFALRKEAGL